MEQSGKITTDASTTNNAQHPTADLFPLSAIASQLMEDVEQIYGLPSQPHVDKAGKNKLCTPQEGKLERLITELGKLKASEIHMYPIRKIWLGWLRFTTQKMNKIFCGHVGMVLVDDIQYLTDDQSNCIEMQQSLMTLKAMAEPLRIPVVALYQLDPSIENHRSTLTKNELAEVEQLSKLTDGLVQMSGTREELVFASPKIPDAKPVEWLNQIRSFSWI